MLKGILILSFAMSMVGAIAICDAQQMISHQSRTVANITATLDALQLPSNAQIVINFTSPVTSKYALPCLSAYRDFRYELLDSTGRIVPIDSQIFVHPPQQFDIQDHWPRIPCEKLWNHQGQTLVWLRRLYPSLSNGAYTLHITFAPRGLGNQQVTFAPIHLVIEN